MQATRFVMFHLTSFLFFLFSGKFLIPLGLRHGLSTIVKAAEWVRL